MFPEKYHYGIDYFLVGVPVGLRGRIGALMSIDSDGSDPRSQNFKSFRYSLKRLLQRCFWFSTDTSRYLHCGDGQMSLTQKLEHFLKEQGEDINDYPYAYLISIPQFCWWTKSPISYWYLYSPSKELSAIIMEINNSYGEKKNAFCRLTKEENSTFDKAKTSETLSTISGRGHRGIQTVRFMSSAPTAKYYKGSWDKDIFASPFEKVEGWFNLRFMDPLDPLHEKGGPLHSNMTLMSVEGKPKLSSRLFSCGTPLDPLSSSSWELTMFLLRWSFVIPTSLGRIVMEALRIRFRGNMPYLNKPDVKKSNIPRNASKPERTLEQFFRMYLSYLVKQCQFPLEVVYTPAKSLHLHPISIHSSANDLALAPAPVLKIQPLTPRFYTNIAKYPDAKLGFPAEIENMPQVSDSISQRLWVSDPVLLKDLINSENPCTGLEKVNPCSPSASRLLWQSTSRGKSFMDNFTDSHCSNTLHTTYRAARIHCYLTEKFAWGSYKLATVYGILLRAIIMRLVWKGLRQMQCNLATGWFADILTVSGTFFLLIRAWRALTGRFYQDL
ncbi:uncharacterized protein N7496_010078 [Penicillium cataractarum]|uniref:Uncharacterized protein n=1 Tax=Penicillium cataractarum TaxID=2100454 RepID=A0A9W9RRJ3_9EURO|nr:uncharacterized protein N7496_010078 [Penicillium cataractarum]KAJ5364365.1 hypothetical protein N7496_010078 [Penicillium cataractarum]